MSDHKERGTINKQCSLIIDSIILRKAGRLALPHLCLRPFLPSPSTHLQISLPSDMLINNKGYRINQINIIAIKKLNLNQCYFMIPCPHLTTSDCFFCFSRVIKLIISVTLVASFSRAWIYIKMYA